MPAPANTEQRSLIDQLQEAMSAGDGPRRVAMLERISDLFMAGSRNYSDEQLALFDDVLVQLSAEIEAKARAELARLVASTDKPVPKLIRSLAFDDAIEVAAPVLSRSPQLSEDDLAENAATKSQDHLLAIAQRISLSELVTDVLLNRGDLRVLRSVASNAGARISLAGYEKLTVQAPSDRALAHAMLSRSDVPRQFFLRLVENASAVARTKLEADIPLAPAAITAAVHDVATALSQDSREASQPHRSAMRDAYQRSGVQPITEANVHAAAEAQRFERTVVGLARLGRFPVDLVERALLDEGADMVLLLARAAGCSWTTTKAILRMYAARRTLSSHDLKQAIAQFQRLSPQTARQVIAFHERRTTPRSGAAEVSAEGSAAAREPDAQPTAPAARDAAPAT
jgi:uncharacterized protein (DUF2336 family)